MLLAGASELVASVPAFSNDNVQRIFQHEVTVLSPGIVKVWFVLMSFETAYMHVFLCYCKDTIFAHSSAWGVRVVLRRY